MINPRNSTLRRGLVLQSVGASFFCFNPERRTLHFLSLEACWNDCACRLVMSDGCDKNATIEETRAKDFCEKSPLLNGADGFVRADLGHRTSIEWSPIYCPETVCTSFLPVCIASAMKRISCRNIWGSFSLLWITNGASWAVQCHRPRRRRQVRWGTKEPTAQRAATRSPHFALRIWSYKEGEKKIRIKTIQISIANLIYGNSTFFFLVSSFSAYA